MKSGAPNAAGIMKALEANGISDSEVVVQMIAAAVASPTSKYGVICPNGDLYVYGNPKLVLKEAGMITFSGANRASEYTRENDGKILYWHPASEVLSLGPCPALVLVIKPIVEAVCLNNLDPIEPRRATS
jgi:hypothetical protein